MAVCAVAMFSTQLLTETWQQAVLWVGVFVFTALTLRFVRHQDWANTAILSAAVVGLGLVSLPAAGALRYALFRPVKQLPARDARRGVRQLTLALDFPAGWQLQAGKSPVTYKRSDPGSGLVQISLFPPADLKSPTGADAERELSEALDAVLKDMKLGPRVALSHEDAAAGPMAFADYQTDAHGPVRFWMILCEARVFASYTDGKSPAAEREIAEAHAALKAASFAHANSR